MKRHLSSEIGVIKRRYNGKAKISYLKSRIFKICKKGLCDLFV